ncbi:hypothetical protein [Streptomyces cyaneofuscatus]
MRSSTPWEANREATRLVPLDDGAGHTDAFTTFVAVVRAGEFGGA